MQAVGEPEQPVVVLRIVEVEDVLVVDEDLADDGAGGFELIVGRDARDLPEDRRSGRGARTSGRHRHRPPAHLRPSRSPCRPRPGAVAGGGVARSGARRLRVARRACQARGRTSSTKDTAALPSRGKVRVQLSGDGFDVGHRARAGRCRNLCIHALCAPSCEGPLQHLAVRRSGARVCHGAGLLRRCLTQMPFS